MGPERVAPGPITHSRRTHHIDGRIHIRALMMNTAKRCLTTLPTAKGRALDHGAPQPVLPRLGLASRRPADSAPPGHPPFAARSGAGLNQPNQS